LRVPSRREMKEVTTSSDDVNYGGTITNEICK